MITQAQYDDVDPAERCPPRTTSTRRTVESEQPYFTSWVTEQLLDRYRAGQVFAAG